MALSKNSDSNKVKINSIIPLADEVEEYDMKIDVSGMAHIINRLTDLYSNPISATVREVTSNALDAVAKLPSLDGGRSRGVNITTPTILNPYFIVQDFGVGMSKKSLLENLSQYGSTTKLTDFDQIGAHGLGAKAPLAYCRELSVVSIHGGRKTEVLLTRSDSGNKVKVVSEIDTNEDTGTTVTVPVVSTDFDDFQKEISTYSEIATDTPLYIDGKLVTTKSKYKLYDEIILDESLNLKGPVWLNTNSKYFDNLGAHQRPISYKFFLSGWIYDGSNSTVNGNYSDFVVELKPGVLNFSSSRDEVTKDKRFHKLSEKIDNKYSTFSGENTQLLLRYYSGTTSEQRKVIYAAAKNSISIVDANSFKLKGQTYSFNDFAVDGEPNYFKNNFLHDFLLTEDENNVYTALDFISNHKYKTITIASTGSFNVDLNYGYFHRASAYPITSINSSVENTIKNNEIYYNLMSYMNALAFDSKIESRQYKATVITDCGEVDFKQLLNARKIMNENLFTNHIVILAASISDEEKAQAKTYIGDSLNFITADELIVKINEIKENIKKNRPKPVVVTRKKFKVLTVGKKHTENSSNSMTRFNYSDVIMELDDLLKEKDSYLAICARNEFPYVLNGMINAGLELEGKKIYQVAFDDLKAKDYTILTNEYKNVYMSPTFTHKSKAFDAFKKVMENGHLVFAKLIDADVEKIAPGSFLKCYILNNHINNHRIYLNRHMNSHVLKLLGERIPEGEFKDVFMKFQDSYLDSYDFNFNDIAFEKVKENYTREEFLQIFKMYDYFTTISNYSGDFDTATYFNALYSNYFTPLSMEGSDILDMVIDKLAGVLHNKIDAIKLIEEGLPKW